MIASGFYGILDVGVITLPFMEMAATVFAGAGVKTVQLRAKGLDTRALVGLAQRLAPIVRDGGGRLLINDRADVAAVAGADGVHLGQQDVPLGRARAILGPDAIIGISTHDEIQARTAAGAADYITFGPVFSTATRAGAAPAVGLERLAAVCSEHALPVVAVGGITLDRCGEARAAGATAVAMIGAVVEGDLASNVAAAMERCE